MSSSRSGGRPTCCMRASAACSPRRDQDWRLTVVDDCYPDTSVGSAANAIGDPRIRYLRNETNLGITDNYRRCLELAEREWIVFLGCDDLLRPDYVGTIRSRRARPGRRRHRPAGRRRRRRARLRRQAPGRPGEATRLRAAHDRPDDAGRGAARRHPCCAATGCTGPRWRSGPRPCADNSSSTAFLSSRTSPSCWTWSLDGSQLLVVPDKVFGYRRHASSASSATIVDGGRFAGERAYFDIAARQCDAHGWPRAARAARAHLASRMHAAIQLPAAARTRSADSARALARHAFGR